MLDENKEHLTAIIVGHVDSGKSTLVGHLLFDLGAISQEQFDEYEKEALNKGKGSFKYAWITDHSKAERERGITIEVHAAEIKTEKYHYTLLDAPGSKYFIKNVTSGASQADVGVLVVASGVGEFEAGYSAEGQTREHALLLFSMGVKQLIVVINKMDERTVLWSEERFNEIQTECRSYLKKIGYNPSEFPFIPASAYHGDNIFTKTTKAAWYKGWTSTRGTQSTTGFTLVDALNNIVPPKRPIEKPFRLPISHIFNVKGIGRILCGSVVQGTISPGAVVGLINSGLKGKEVISIEEHHVRLDKASPGDYIGLHIDGIDEKTDVKVGDVLYIQEEGELKAIDTFTAQVVVLNHPTQIKTGYSPVFDCGTNHVACKFTKLLQKVDRRSGKVLESEPMFLKSGEVGTVEFKPLSPHSFFVESFSECPPLGRFVIRDSGRIVAVGAIKNTMAVI